MSCFFCSFRKMKTRSSKKTKESSHDTAAQMEKKTKESSSDSIQNVGKLVAEPVPEPVATKTSHGEETSQEYLTVYVGEDRKVFKVPASFKDYESFKELLQDARHMCREKDEIVQDLGDGILFDFVKVDYFEYVKKNLERKEREKRALAKSYCDLLWINK